MTDRALDALSEPDLGTESASTGDDPSTGTDATGDTAPTSSAGSSTATTATESGGEDDEDEEEEMVDEPSPPKIVGFDLTPQPLTIAGAITVEATVEAAEGVQMTYGADLTQIELAPDPESPGVYQAELAVVTGFDNGEHAATLTPWRTLGEQRIWGEAVEVAYTTALPEPGKQVHWEAASILGLGFGRKLLAMPSGHVLEIGETYAPKEGGRCYLRRRNPEGSWTAEDVVALLPGTDCAAVDLAITPEGSIFILVKRVLNQQQSWWLGELTEWGAPITNRGFGASGELGVALAHDGDGTIAICGTVPTQSEDTIDAAAWILRPKLGAERLTFDYRPTINYDQHFAERVRDCVFAADGTLYLAGEAYGLHPDDLEEPRRRHLVLEVDPIAATHSWWVGGVDLAIESGANAISLDDQGRVLTAGYHCGSPCTPTPVLRLLGHQGAPLWTAQIGELGGKHTGPYDVAWSPAGYAVVAFGIGKDKGHAFAIQAFSTDALLPRWTYLRSDPPAYQEAYAVTVGPFGQVYAIGFGSGMYPAIAFIAG